MPKSGLNQWDGHPHTIRHGYARVEGLINFERKEHKVWSLSPSSLQTTPTLCPSLTHLTASSLNSAVYARFGIFISCLPKVTPIPGHPLAEEISGETYLGCRHYLDIHRTALVRSDYNGLL